MFYLDSQCIVTQRDSSIVRSGGCPSSRFNIDRATEPLPDPWPRAKGSIRNEIITSMFETMLNVIVDSWEIIGTNKPRSTVSSHEKRRRTLSAASSGTVKKNKKQGQRSKLFLHPSQMPPAEMYTVWWSGQDERAIIHFKNGNIYEGDISMKLMHGQGRYQWADGTVYMGHFDKNTMKGQGQITWPNSTWYVGEFADNVRHGRGLFVDSRLQTCYCGDWQLGTKHGKGFMSYSASFQNTYDGEWVENVRQGMGVREYCARSVYYGDWLHNKRAGFGLMIWPNQDAFIGQWSNSEISGFGKYMWNVYNNKDLVLHTIQNYQGFFDHGNRCEAGVLDLGFRNEFNYQGKFENNMKLGRGTLLIGQYTDSNEILFHGDVIFKCSILKENFTNETIDVGCHIEETILNIGRDGELKHNKRVKILNNYLQNNQWLHTNLFEQIDDLMKFDIRYDEEHDLLKSIKCYKLVLYEIYEHYASICHPTDHAKGQPPYLVLIRLFLWQFYYDCNLEQRGLTQVEIDNMVAAHSHWRVKSAHDPFEKIYFWQFLHIIVLLARHLYAKTTLPGPKPDNILQCAFSYFITNDILLNCCIHKGNMLQYVDVVPLKALYDLYASLGEPHTVREFLRAARGMENVSEGSVEIELVDADTQCLPIGRNMFVFGNLVFQNDERFFSPQLECYGDHQENKLKLFNIGNLSSKNIIKMFIAVFPNIYKDGRILNLDIEMTFFEFYEAFIACCLLSIRNSNKTPPRSSTTMPVVATKSTSTKNLRSHRQ